MIKILLLPAITAAGIALVDIPPAKAQVRITFPVTSYCGGYGGPSEQFLIELGGKQDLVFEMPRKASESRIQGEYFSRDLLMTTVL